MRDDYPDTLTQVPTWLEVPSHSSRLQSDSGDSHIPTTVPSFLTPADQKDIREQIYLTAFEWVIPKVAMGSSITFALAEYHHHIDPVTFRRWIMRDPIRKALYHDAKECNADYESGMLSQLASGFDRNGIPYDPAYMNAAASIYKWKMSKYNRKQYGDVKQIDVSGGISVTAALEEAQGRVIEGRSILLEEDAVELLDEPVPDDLTESEDDDE